MIQVKCNECGAINRLEGYSHKRIPYCGSCKRKLNEPFGVVTMRFLNSVKYWIVLVFIGVSFFLINESKHESSSIPTSVAPAAITSLDDQFTDDPVVAKKYRVPLSFVQGVNSVMSDAPLVAPFRIVTPYGKESYFVKLVDATTGRDIMKINVHGGQSFETKVPLGRMKVRYATGLHWYGEEENILFGDDTAASESDSVFEFFETEEGVSGYTIELIKQVNGNMRTHEIPKSKF